MKRDPFDCMALNILGVVVACALAAGSVVAAVTFGWRVWVIVERLYHG